MAALGVYVHKYAVWCMILAIKHGSKIMENLVVTLETAKRLKAGGFPQKTLCLWVFPDQAKPWISIHDQIVAAGKVLVRTWAAAPTAQEIADELPRGIQWELFPTPKDEPAGVRTRIGFAYSGVTTMAEALADLWVLLREEK